MNNHKVHGLSIRRRFICCTCVTAITVMSFADPATAEIIRFDISAQYNYDLVGTKNEADATTSNVSVFLGDHNYLSNQAYTNQGSVPSGTALPDNGILGNYQLGPYDNGTDYQTRSKNAIAFRTHTTTDGVTEGQEITRTISLTSGQQGLYSGINLAFVNRKTVHGSISYRTWIEVAYTDDTTQIVFDTGLTGSTGGALGGGGVADTEGVVQGGFYSTVDSTTIANKAPGNSDTFAPKLLLGMDQRLNGSTVGPGTAAVWELDSFIPLDPTKTLESITIGFRGPAANTNRQQQFYVLAISGQSVPEPASVGLIGIGGVLLLRRRRTASWH